MIPTLDNLDQWLFDSFEGNLSPEQQELLDHFLAQHPDLSPEQDAWEQAAFVANPITFEPKSALYRKKEWNYKPFAAAALLLLLFGATYFYTSSNKNTAKQVQQAKASSKTTRQSSSKSFQCLSIFNFFNKFQVVWKSQFLFNSNLFGWLFLFTQHLYNSKFKPDAPCCFQQPFFYE